MRYAVKEIPCAQVVVMGRYRKDMGDLGTLARSIERNGQMQPIGVTPQLRLVFGERRLRAIRDVLGLKSIAAAIIDSDRPVELERDENECRKDFTPSERYAIGNAIKPVIAKRRVDRIADDAKGHKGEARDAVDRGIDGGDRTSEIAAKEAGFTSENQMRRVGVVIYSGNQELIDLMDASRVTLYTAAELAALPPGTLREAVARIQSGDKPSDVLQEAKAAQAPPPTKDAVGCEVPLAHRDVFAARRRYKVVQSQARRLQQELDRLAREVGGETLRATLTHKAQDDGSVRHHCSHLKSSARNLRETEPWAAYCPYCFDAPAGTPCTGCKGRGWVPRAVWERAAPDLKAKVLAAKGAENGCADRRSEEGEGDAA